MKPFDGPLVIEPVWTATHKTTLFTGRSRNNVHPMQVKRIHKAVTPEPAFTKATLRAKRPIPNVIPDPSGQDDGSNSRVQKLELRQDATQHRKGRDGKRDSSE